MTRLMRFSGSVVRDPGVDVWLKQRRDALSVIAKRWLGVMRECGPDVRELLHDGHPTACVGDAAFAFGASIFFIGYAVLVFLLLALRVFANGATDPKQMEPEKHLFGYSVFYLFALFAALVADRWIAW